MQYEGKRKKSKPEDGENEQVKRNRRRNLELFHRHTTANFPLDFHQLVLQCRSSACLSGEGQGGDVALSGVGGVMVCVQNVEHCSATLSRVYLKFDPILSIASYASTGGGTLS